MTIEARILDLMAQRPTGLTSSEIEEVTRHEVSAYSASSRLSAMAKAGTLVRAGKRKGPSGGVGTVYRLSDPRLAPPTLPGMEP